MNDATTAPAAAAPPGPVAGIVITVIAVVIIVAWILLGLIVLHLQPTSLVGGFLLLYYWANNGQLDIKQLPAAIIGGLVGIFLSWFVVHAEVQWGSTGLALALALFVLALYLDVIKALPMVVNTSTMLYLTVAAAPLVQLHVDWQELVISTVVGGAFFGLLVEGLKRLAARFAPSPA